MASNPSSKITLSVTLPTDLHRRAKKYAKSQHRSLSSVVRQAVQEYLDANEEAPSVDLETRLTNLERVLTLMVNQQAHA
jgi:metal-responsive CopG/Arc/MetJ family transcriptional regulator